MAGDHVQRSLAEDDSPLLGLFDDVHRVEEFALLEDQRLPGIDVLRLSLRVERAPGEADHVAAYVDQRKNHAVAELIVEIGSPVFLLGDGEIGGEQLGTGIALLFHRVRQTSPSVGSEADAEAADRVPVQTPAEQIGPSGLTVAAFELIVEKPCCVLAERPETLLLAIAALAFAAYKANYVSKMAPGSSRMQEISSAIAEGASAFLKSEYKILAVFILVRLLYLSYDRKKGFYGKIFL